MSITYKKSVPSFSFKFFSEKLFVRQVTNLLVSREISNANLILLKINYVKKKQQRAI